MRVGLLTVYFADYGSFYHTVALYRLLEKMGHDVELIDESHRYKESPKLFFASIARIHFPKWLNQALRKRIDSYNTYCILKKDLQKLKLAPEKWLSSKAYDCVIIGSDELWALTSPDVRYIKKYFGIGIETSHISYATSGISLVQEKVPAHIKQQIVAGLRTFTRLSVRDEVTKDWVEEWCGKLCEKVLDPTLLNPCFVQQADQKNVIVVYGEHFSKEQQAAITQFAKVKNMPLQAISWRHSWCDSFLEAKCAADVQSAFASAAYCISSTFHGTIFSVLAHRPFTSFMSNKRGVKVRSLLKDLSLENRIFEENSGINEDKIDYDAVENILREKRSTSLRYLKSALEACEKMKGEASHAV